MKNKITYSLKIELLNSLSPHILIIRDANYKEVKRILTNDSFTKLINSIIVDFAIAPIKTTQITYNYWTEQANRISNLIYPATDDKSKKHAEKKLDIDPKLFESVWGSYVDMVNNKINKVEPNKSSQQSNLTCFGSTTLYRNHIVNNNWFAQIVNLVKTISLIHEIDNEE